MAQPRTVFFVSDRTGITVEMLGNSLLTQFDEIEFQRVTLPFIDNIEKARDVLNQVERECGFGKTSTRVHVAHDRNPAPRNQPRKCDGARCGGAFHRAA